MTNETHQTLLAPAREVMENLVRKAGPRRYSVPTGEDYWDIQVHADGTYQRGRYVYREDDDNAIEYGAPTPLSEMGFTTLAHIADDAARELAPDPSVLARRAAEQRQRAVEQRQRDVFEERKRVSNSMMLQALVCPPRDRLAPITNWPPLLGKDEWKLDVAVHAKGSSPGPARQAYLEVEFAPDSTELLRASLTLKDTGKLLGSSLALAPVNG